jgi:hypothetical protein
MYLARSGTTGFFCLRHIFKPSKKYPVIYFLHGWSQRYFGDGGQNYEQFDSGNQSKGDNIANFVSSHDVIVVKSDGYNRSPGEKYYFRPYNVTPVETFRQFPIYYPELIDYIDAITRRLLTESIVQSRDYRWVVL